MKIKHFPILVLLLLTVIISIGSIAASEDLEVATDLDNSDNGDSLNLADNIVDGDSIAQAGSDESAVLSDSDESEDQDDSDDSTAQSESSDSSTNEKTSKSVKKISTKVSADQVANEYMKSKYFKVKVKDRNGKYVKNVKINLKVYTGSKFKRYTVKTNYKGIAKFNTKSLRLGNHKVVISSADDKYKISKTSKIFIGKKRYVTLRSKSKKVLRNKDVIGYKIVKDEDEKEVHVVYKKTPKFTRITKAIFYFKNKITCKIIKEIVKSEFDDGHWEWPDEDFPRKYSFAKVKIYFLSSK